MKTPADYRGEELDSTRDRLARTNARATALMREAIIRFPGLADEFPGFAPAEREPTGMASA
jgi:hypothetical protein